MMLIRLSTALVLASVAPSVLSAPAPITLGDDIDYSPPIIAQREAQQFCEDFPDQCITKRHQFCEDYPDECITKCNPQQFCDDNSDQCITKRQQFCDDNPDLCITKREAQNFSDSFP